MGTEWLLLAVPKQDYDELKHMVDFRQKQRGEAPAPTAEQLRDSQLAKDAVVRAAFAKHEPWPEHALARLAEGSAITTQRFAQVMDLCAATPGEDHRYSTKELAEKTGMNVNEWRSACRKIRLHLEKHYPEIPRTDAGNPEWPLVDMSGRTLGERDQLYVGITEEQARRWRTVG